MNHIFPALLPFGAKPASGKPAGGIIGAKILAEKAGNYLAGSTDHFPADFFLGDCLSGEIHLFARQYQSDPLGQCHASFFSLDLLHIMLGLL